MAALTVSRQRTSGGVRHTSRPGFDCRSPTLDHSRIQVKQNSCAHDSGTPIFVLWVDLRQMAQAEEGWEVMLCDKLTNTHYTAILSAR